MLSGDPMEKKLQLSSIILIIGLLVEGFCLLGRGPIAFLLFVNLAGLLLLVGIAIFLLALTRSGHEKSKPRRD